ncbi:MAG: DUF86 domain-containing protein [Candidatus Hydrogenedentes bacterium]|nr:DUF86 domain-containing protein [Candidatus Hydrogenedentota bacterium]
MSALLPASPNISANVYRLIIRLRHILVHGYDVITPDIIWEIITNKIPILVQELDAMIKGL